MVFSNLVSELPSRSPQDNLLHRITTCIRQSLQLQEILHATVTEVRSFLKTDRVMVYRFHPDEHGEVIAEALQNQQLPALVGLHFPADDIPPEARELFLKLRQCSIVDLSAQQIGWSTLYPFAGGVNPPGNVCYHPVDSCHSAYLSAMGVQASVVVPILQQEELWGLLVAHHSQPRSISEAELHFLQLVVEQVAIAIAQANLLNQVQAQAQREGTANRIATLLYGGSANPLGTALDATVEVVGGSGGRLFLLPTQSNPAGKLYTWGDQPIDPMIADGLLEQHSLWQAHDHPEGVAIADLYQDARCHSLIERFQSTQIRSLLIIPLQQGQQPIGYLTLFRNEIDTERLWAGKFDPDERQQMPRQSFELWRERKTKQAQGWTKTDLNLVLALKSHFVSAISQYQLQIQVQTLNLSLERQVQERTRDLANIHFAIGQSSIVGITDSKGMIGYVNDRFCEISQYSRAELIGQSHQIINSGYHSKQFFSQMWQTITHGDVWRGEIKNRAKDGSEYWVDTTIVPLLNEQDKPQQYVAIRNDITNRKLAEARLREQEQFFRTVYEGVEHVITLIDVIDGEFRYVGWNPIGEKLSGILSAEITGKTPEELFGQANGAAVRQNYERCINAGASICYEEYLPFQKQNIWWLTTINPLRDEVGRINRLVLTAVTITERKQAEEALQQKVQQLAHTLKELQHTQAKLVQTEKMSSLGQLVAGIAHEINNPVNFIFGNINHAGEYTHDLLNLLQLYQHHYPQPVPAIQMEADEIDLDFLKEDLPKLLTSMKVGAERIQTIVLALRNFSRMDEAEVKAVNLHEGIDSTLMILQSRIKATAERTEIQVVKDYGNLPLIECYAGQLNQVFMNILSNAIDALDEYNSQRPLEEQQQKSATITIQTELVGTNSQEISSHRKIHIRIADNGPGMTEPVRQRLFEPFFTTKPVGKGTGLGLSISYQVVVDKHAGNLFCISTPGKGAEFLIELPLLNNTEVKG
jgi:two-component system NtrC family sensor kinase